MRPQISPSLPPEIAQQAKLAQEQRHGFELYWVTLTFTLVALAVQTAKPSAVAWVSCVELVGWLLLLAGGCVGLWRLNWLWRRQHWEGNAIAESYGGGDEATKIVQAIEAKLETGRRWQFVTFATGFALIVIARAALLLGSIAGPLAV